MKIDPEFKTLIPPLTSEEKSQLQESILKEGCRDALVLWKGILIDGHNRHEICRINKIPFKTVSLHLDTRTEVKNWIILNQLGRRNLTSEARNYLIGKFYSATKQTHGGNRKNGKNGSSSPQNEDLKKTSHRIAEQIKIGKATVERAEKFAQAVDKLSGLHGEGLKNRILSRGIKATQEEILKLSCLPENHQRIVLKSLQTSSISVKEAVKKAVREEKIKLLTQKSKSFHPNHNIQLYVGDFRNISNKIDNESIDLILTDPPYGKSALTYWKDLGEIAMRVLKPSRFLISYVGNLYLPEVLESLTKTGLIYYWVGMVKLPNKINHIYHRNVWNYVRPVLFFQKPPIKKGNFFQDFLESPEAEKDYHDWQQNCRPLQYLIRRFTEPGETVLDTFVGAGSVAIATLIEERKCVGFDIDKKAIEIAKGRIAEYIKDNT